MKQEDLQHFANNFQKIYQAKQSINPKQVPQRKKNDAANWELAKRGLAPQLTQSVQAPKGLFLMEHASSKNVLQNVPERAPSR